MRSYSKVTLRCLARDRGNQYLLPAQVPPCCPERSEDPAQSQLREAVSSGQGRCGVMMGVMGHCVDSS